MEHSFVNMVQGKCIQLTFRSNVFTAYLMKGCETDITDVKRITNAGGFFSVILIG